MSRSLHTFFTEITEANGTKRQVMSLQSLNDQSILVNYKSNRGALFLLMTVCSQGNILGPRKTLLLFRDVWERILGFALGLSQLSQYGQNPLIALGNYAVAIRRPASIFTSVKMDSFIIVDATIRGQEDMVMNILKADPSFLLKKAKVKNSVGIEYEVTPLQAAMMANDPQMAEKMKEHFARLPNGIVAMQEQILQIYKESFRVYFDKQEAKIACLTELKTSGITIDEAALTKAQTHDDAYLTALRSDDINVIFEAHNQAQEDNAFDFQPYVDAILSASSAELDDVTALIKATTPEETAAVIARTGVAAKETDAARVKPFNELTLVEKLNRFREKLVEHMQQELIFNPNHILEGLRHNDLAFSEVDAGRIADPSYQKRSVIFTQLTGWTQRCAAEPVKQEIRQGTFFLTEKNRARTRPSRFNDFDRNDSIAWNSLVDVSLSNSSIIDGLGYTFSMGDHVLLLCEGDEDRARLSIWFGRFSKLVSSKNIELGKLIQSAKSCQSRSRPDCVMM